MPGTSPLPPVRSQGPSSAGRIIRSHVLSCSQGVRPADPGDKNYADDRLNEAHRNETERRTAFAGPRARTVQSLSIDAARMYAEGHFDWVYLDALHTRDAVLGDLQAWWTALRPGGLLTGDDYGDIEDTEYVSAGLTQCPETAHMACSQCRCAH